MDGVKLTLGQRTQKVVDACLEGRGTNAAEGFQLLASRILHAEGQIGGPRCCKRNAYAALRRATAYVREHYGAAMESGTIVCCEPQRTKLPVRTTPYPKTPTFHVACTARRRGGQQ